ncbi:hypothetical protein BH23GEM6_BH23GEM6_07960 [soil metagenome]
MDGCNENGPRTRIRRPFRSRRLTRRSQAGGANRVEVEVCCRWRTRRGRRRLGLALFGSLLNDCEAGYNRSNGDQADTQGTNVYLTC